MSATAQAVQPAQQVLGAFGAPELKQNFKKFTQKALIIAVIIHFSIIGGIKLVNTILANRKPPREIVIAKFKVLAPPPPLSSAPPPPVAVAAPIAPPTVGVPVPVPDAEAPEEQTVASQEEISAFNPNATADNSGTGDIVIAEPTQTDETPAFGEFVYYEEAPTLINMPPPAYPDLAREAGLEGVVKVQALIGKDGQVKDVKVVKSIQMLDDSAVQSVRRSSWKPALNNNKPVSVWVEVPVRFSLN